MDTQMINFMIPTTLLKQVDSYAREESTTRSDFLRDAVRNYLEKQRAKNELAAAVKANAKLNKLSYEEAIKLAEEAKKWARQRSK